MIAKILKNEAEYDEALEQIDILLDAEPDTPEMDQLELLSFLVGKYEDEHYPIDLPTPIDAIRFRMDQQGLTRKDLIPYLGSQGKVSDVLNGKRSLSLNMIRKLHEGLGISAEVLLQKPGAHIEIQKYNRSDYPFNEMFNNDYFAPNITNLSSAKEKSEELLINLFEEYSQATFKIACRQGNGGDKAKNALFAWHANIMKNKISKELCSFSVESINEAFINKLVKLSAYEKGITLVEDELNKIGIHFVISERLQKTKLDGACFFAKDKHPVVAMTLRFNRLDNFWFTLMHELGHLVKQHVTSNNSQVIMDNTFDSRTEENSEEDDADKFALNSLIPDNIWKKNKQNLLSGTAEDVKEFAEQLEISPSIVAGRIQWTKKDYKKLSGLVGHHLVREQLV
jgi:HTH-type transcriptional regulator/antitoxin HigA